MSRVFLCKKKRNPRQVSPERLESALKLNYDISVYFSYVYSIPDRTSLEEVGLEAIAEICSKVRKTQRHKGFLSLCNKCIRARVVDYLRKCSKENAGKIRAAMILRHYTSISIGSERQQQEAQDDGFLN